MASLRPDGFVGLTNAGNSPLESRDGRSGDAGPSPSPHSASRFSNAGTALTIPLLVTAPKLTITADTALNVNEMPVNSARLHSKGRGGRGGGDGGDGGDGGGGGGNGDAMEVEGVDVQPVVDAPLARVGIQVVTLTEGKVLATCADVTGQNVTSAVMPGCDALHSVVGQRVRLQFTVEGGAMLYTVGFKP